MYKILLAEACHLGLYIFPYVYKVNNINALQVKPFISFLISQQIKLYRSGYRRRNPYGFMTEIHDTFNLNILNSYCLNISPHYSITSSQHNFCEQNNHSHIIQYSIQCGKHNIDKNYYKSYYHYFYYNCCCCPYLPTIKYNNNKPPLNKR